MLRRELSAPSRGVQVGEFLIDVSTVQWAYFGLLIAFTICLAMLSPLTSSSGLKLWLLSNFATATAIPLFIWPREFTSEALAFLLPATLVVTSAALKLLAVSSRAVRRSMMRPLVATIIAFAVGYQIFTYVGLASARLALAMGLLSLITGGIAVAAKINPLWRGLWGRRLLIAAFTLSSILLAVISVRAVAGGASPSYFAKGTTESLIFALNIIQVIVVHIGFIALVVGRLAKITAFKAARQQQLMRRRQIAEQHGRQMEVIALERRALLDLLSHEVRQPLNNAQAALQEISRHMGRRKLQELGMSQPVSRLYNIIDQVVLALSNAIVGTSVIERRTDQERREVEVAAIAELARGDCPIDMQSRINLSGLYDPVFMQGDPILLRLAFRNLLDNALKFSPVGSSVQAAVRIDSKRLGICFEVLNEPKEAFHPDTRLFDRTWRGGSGKVPGKGLGLFIVHEVAHIHKGTVTASVIKDGQTRFELFLPL